MTPYRERLNKGEYKPKTRAKEDPMPIVVEIDGRDIMKAGRKPRKRTSK